MVIKIHSQALFTEIRLQAAYQSADINRHITLVPTNTEVLTDFCFFFHCYCKRTPIVIVDWTCRNSAGLCALWLVHLASIICVRAGLPML